jgi:hypothetical protein
MGALAMMWQDDSAAMKQGPPAARDLLALL